MSRELGDRMVADDRFKLLTFTGSPVGRLADEGARRQEAGRARAGRQRRRHRRQVRRPRLGGQAHRSSVPSAMPARCASASSACSSTGHLRRRSWTSLSRARRRSRSGDPLDPETQTRPDGRRAQAAARTERWVREAEELGGRVLVGGRADGAFFPPTVLVDTPPEAQVCSQRGLCPARRRLPVRRLR